MHVNGTRKAFTDTKLGWQRLSPRAFVLPVRSLCVSGGDVAVMDVVVQRVRTDSLPVIGFT
jgi:hypothetical protein